ncbi:MAG: hypothetical protein OEV73_10625, partial [Desulfobulbaceae bacterium]|nr:hypothetical protein [Desulfobulbaceae bacterium]
MEGAKLLRPYLNQNPWRMLAFKAFSMGSGLAKTYPIPTLSTSIETFRPPLGIAVKVLYLLPL